MRLNEQTKTTAGVVGGIVFLLILSMFLMGKFPLRPTAKTQNNPGIVSLGVHTRAHTVGRCVPIRMHRQLGIAINPPIQTTALSTGKLTGNHYGYVEIYNIFGKKFQWHEVRQVENSGAVPVIQLNPRKVRLTDIVAGKDDAYLRQYAKEVKTFGCSIVLSFGHEMNGTWYPWGCLHTSAKTFVAAWQHIVRAMKPAGNVIWMWTVNVTTPTSKCALTSRWPGGKYVNWVGLDGYLRHPSDKFPKVFSSSVTALDKLGKPLIFSEEGALAGTNQANRITNLYKGAASSKAAIIIYFFGRTSLFGDYRPATSNALTAMRDGQHYFRTH